MSRFQQPSEPDLDRKELRSGYVLVRDGVPGTYFLTLRKNLD